MTRGSQLITVLEHLPQVLDLRPKTRCKGKLGPLLGRHVSCILGALIPTARSHCSHLSSIIARSTIRPTGACGAGGPLHSTLSGEASLALEGKYKQREDCSRTKKENG